MTPADARRHGIAPSMTEITSASQVKLWRECARKWAWKYIAHVDVEQLFESKLGDEVDKEQLQPYLTLGRPFDYSRESGSGYIAAAGLAYLPPPQSPGLAVQKKFEIPSPSSVPGQPAPFAFLGYMDLFLPDGRYMPLPPDVAPSSDALVIPAVGDFKTTGNVDKPWILTPETLATDPQAQLYAAATMFETGARVVDLVWIYFQTKGAKKTKRVHLRVDGQHVVEQLMAIDATAHELVHAKATVTDPLALPPNPLMCDQYRGCPYRAHCNLSPDVIADAKAAHEAKKRLEIIETQKGNVNVSNQTSALLARLQARAGGAAPAPAAPPAPLGINPPEASLPPAPPVGQATPQPAPAAPARRGRPPKAAAQAPAPAAPPPPPTPAPVTRAAAVEQAAGSRIATLYVDCYPVGPDYTTAEELYKAVAEQIQAKHGVPDYRLIDFKGAGVFASELGAIVDSAASWGDIVLDSRTPEGAIAKSILVFRAGAVVQGVR